MSFGRNGDKRTVYCVSLVCDKDRIGQEPEISTRDVWARRTVETPFHEPGARCLRA